MGASNEKNYRRHLDSPLWIAYCEYCQGPWSPLLMPTLRLIASCKPSSPPPANSCDTYLYNTFIYAFCQKRFSSRCTFQVFTNYLLLIYASRLSMLMSFYIKG